MNSKPVLKIE